MFMFFIKGLLVECYLIIIHRIILVIEKESKQFSNNKINNFHILKKR